MRFCLFLHVHLSCEFFKEKKRKLKNDKKEFRVIGTNKNKVKNVYILKIASSKISH